jgi:hypothetical protein
MPAQNNQTHSPLILAEESKAKWVNGSAHPIPEIKILDSIRGFRTKKHPAGTERAIIDIGIEDIIGIDGSMDLRFLQQLNRTLLFGFHSNCSSPSLFVWLVADG